jgi:lipopolysaccharide transport system permease protein
VSAAAPAVERPVFIIRPSRGWMSLGLAEIWAYRELLYFLVWRDIKVRYKQTALGAAWAVLQPLMTMIVFTVFFGKLANVGSDGLPYPLFSYAGLLPWTFFAQGLSMSSDSLVGQSALIKRVYFPRLVIPASSVLAGTVDFSIAFVILLGMMVGYHVHPTAAIVFLPLFLLLALATSLGVGVWLSALNVEYRDVKYVVPFVIQIWLFVTPVIYPSAKVTKWLAAHGLPGWLYGLNPMTGVVEGFRWALFGVGARPGPVVAASAAMSLGMLVAGAYYFRRMERTFADVV